MTITAHGLFVAGWVAALLAWLFAAYHYIAFYQKFERARLAGMIPQTLLRRRMAIGWFLATAEWVPGGAYHRSVLRLGIRRLLRDMAHAGAAVAPLRDVVYGFIKDNIPFAKWLSIDSGPSQCFLELN